MLEDSEHLGGDSLLTTVGSDGIQEGLCYTDPGERWSRYNGCVSTDFMIRPVFFCCIAVTIAIT